MRLLNVHMLIKQRPKKPALSVPDAHPLSPCIVHPYVENADVKEENKGYVPVSLLMRAIDDDRMLNIAVAGNYGVGKSSELIQQRKNLINGSGSGNDIILFEYRWLHC